MRDEEPAYGHDRLMVSTDLGHPTSARRTARLTTILDTVSSTGQIRVGELARALRVSEATVRRDLALLDTQYLIRRTHGGASAQDYAYELPVRYRDAQQRLGEEADRLPGCAQAISRKPQAVALGGGTTTTEVARQLADRSELTIVTNAINIAMELAMRPRAAGHRHRWGHALRSPAELVGAWTERFLEALNIGVAVLGVDGLSPGRGLTTHDAVEARTNQRMIERSQRVIVVADRTKLGVVTMAKIADTTDVDLLITEADAPADQVASLRAAGLRSSSYDGSASRRPSSR